MDEIQANIKKFGDQRNLKLLQEYIATIDIDELTSFVTERISYRNILPIWSYLLESFTDSADSHEKRFKIATVVLNQSETTKISNPILNRLRSELPKFKTNHLIEFCDFCIEKIQRGQATDTSWKDLLPQILNILVANDFVTYNDTEMSGLEYIKHVVNSLCMINWSPNILTPLTAMFCDISLTKEEHLQVVSKLGNSMEKMPCQEIPAITYQLLRFCSTQNSLCIFLRLQSYFMQRIKKKVDNLPGSDTTDFDDISDSQEHDALQVESTVLFHVHNVAMLGDGSINGYISSLKNMLKAPEVVLHPFQLTVLLTISTASLYEEPTLEIIRSCIVRVVTEDFKKLDSYWFNEIITNTTKIRDIFSDVIDNSIKERNLVISGLINLSFTLLGAGAGLGAKNIAEAQWDLATFILIKLMKRKHDVSNTVLQKLCNRIVTVQNVSHLTDCLHKMCRNVTLCVVENQNVIVGLTEEILDLPGPTGRLVIESIIPLIKVSHTVRDNLILILRKALYHRKIETKQMAVRGYLNLLKHLRISNMAALSLTQENSTSSSYSFATQMSLDRETHNNTQKFSNEALCLEVLGILRRCFMQQSEVRAELYEGLYEAICVNSELGMPVLDLLWVYFKQFYNDDEDVKPPILFDKIMVTKGVEVVLQEPIGQFIQGIGRIVTKVKETHDIQDPDISRFVKILDSLCNRMPQCELVHFNLDDGCDLLDTLPESQRGLLVLKQAMSVYEALMGYLIGAWTPQSEDFAQKINKLFVGYSRLVDHSKNLSKPKKAENRKKAKDETKSKSSPIIFKPIPTTLDFQSVTKILHLLHDPTVSWANIAQVNILKVKPEFHRYIFNTIIQLIQTVKSSKCEIIQNKSIFKYFTDISTVLYERIIKQLSNVIDFDCTTAVLGIECFHTILSLIVTHCKEKLGLFLSVISSNGSKRDEAIGDHLMPFIKIIHAFFEADNTVYAEDPEGKKLPVLLVEIYKILVLNLPLESPQMPTVLDWLKRFTVATIVPNKSVGQIFIALLLTIHVKCKSSSGLYENIAIRLGDIMGTVSPDKPECPVPLKILNEGTVLTTLISLTNILKTMLNEVDWLVQRLRAEYCMIIYPGGDKIERRKELLKNKEREICSHLCQIINVCSMVSNLSVPSGSNAEVIFKILIHLFQTLNSITKYFVHISSTLNPAFESARFEQVLQLSGKPLSDKVNDFILYVEEGHNANEEPIVTKKKTPDANTLKTKALRETRLIPKLVYEMEQFGRCVITLSKKTKINLSKFVGLGISRDFRIKGPQLQEALEKNRDDRVSDSDETLLSEQTDMAAMDICEEEEEEINNETSMEIDGEASDADESPPLKKVRK